MATNAFTGYTVRVTYDESNVIENLVVAAATLQAAIAVVEDYHSDKTNLVISSAGVTDDVIIVDDETP